MTELDALVWGNLKRLEELGVLDGDVRILDHEQVGWRTAPGVLLLSQRRVLFFRASPGPDESYEFEYISGGKVRAEEIARAILDQRAALVE